MHEQRFVVSDVLLQRLGSDRSGKFSDAGATAKDNRLFLQAVLWRFAVARSATCLWPLEQPVPAVSPVGQVWCIRVSFQSSE